MYIHKVDPRTSRILRRIWHRSIELVLPRCCRVLQTYSPTWNLEVSLDYILYLVSQTPLYTNHVSSWWVVYQSVSRKQSDWVSHAMQLQNLIIIAPFWISYDQDVIGIIILFRFFYFVQYTGIIIHPREIPCAEIPALYKSWNTTYRYALVTSVFHTHTTELEYCWAMLAYNCETAIGVGSKSVVLQSDKLATANNDRWRSFSGFVSTQEIDFSIKLQKFAQRFAVFFERRLHTHSEISSQTRQTTK